MTTAHTITSSQTVITTAFETYRRQCELDKQPVILDEIILANIADLDLNAPIDKDNISIDASTIVYRNAPTQISAVNHNAVSYALVLDTAIGDFSFNAMYLINKTNNTIGMAIYKGTEHKIKSTPEQIGNSLVKTLIMEYTGASAAIEMNVDANTWTIDYQARLASMMTDERQSTKTALGDAVFIGNGFKFANNQLSQGAAYIQGVYVETAQAISLTPANQQFIVLDVWQTGTPTGSWQSYFKVTLADTAPQDYIDAAGISHYCAVIAQKQNNQWLDKRKDTLLTQHLHHADPHSQYLQKANISQDETDNHADHVPSSAVTAKLKEKLDFAISVGQGMVLDLGAFDASKGTYPPKPYINDNQGNGQLVSAFWFVTKGGTINGIQYEINDKINYSRVTDAYFKTDNTETLSLSQAESLFARIAHDHQWAQIQGKPEQATRWPSWNEISSKPATMPPSAHNHDDRYFTEAEANSRYQAKGAYAASVHSHTWSQISGIPVYATRWANKAEVGLSNVPNTVHTATATINTVAVRDSAGDINARLFRSSYSNQSDISGAMAFRFNTTDNYIRFCSNPTAIRNWLGAAAASHSHPWSQISGIPAQATRWPNWNEVGSKPTYATRWSSLTESSQQGKRSLGSTVYYRDIAGKVCTFSIDADIDTVCITIYIPTLAEFNAWKSGVGVNNRYISFPTWGDGFLRVDPTNSANKVLYRSWAILGCFVHG